ncbi:MAG: heavy metal translocating P-type ATPase [Armatimonadota bacterium]
MTNTELEITAFAPEITECEDCIAQLVDALMTLDGVAEAEMCGDDRLCVSYDAEMTSFREIERKAQAIGVEVTSDLDKVTYQAEELCCTECAERVANIAGRLSGVHAVSANFAAQVVEVTYHPATISQSQLHAAVERAVGECHGTEERKLTLRVEGMDCASCAQTIATAAERREGVSHATVNFTGGTAEIQYDPTEIEPEKIIETIRSLGYGVQRAGVVRSRFTVRGIDCADCATGIEGALEERDGLISAEVNAATGKLVVEHDPQRLPIADVIATVEALGYEISAEDGAAPEEGLLARIRGRPRSILTLLCGVFLVTGLILGWAGAGEAAVVATLSISIILGGYHIARSAIISLRTSLAADMNVLMTVAVIGAMAIGEWYEAATVVLLFSVANALETFTSDRTRNAIRSLMALSPDTATVLRDGEEVSVAAENVAIGDVVVVRPGERLPVDGVVEDGESEINQAPVTGESEPVAVSPGSEVFAGTVNGPGLLEIRSTKTAGDTTIARIIHMVEEAQAQRSPSQRFVDRFARYYTPIVIALAALITAIPPLAFGEPFTPWFYRALTLLVLACPCALVISTPVAIAAAIANGARNGVLVKGGAYIERLATIRQFVFDKTGTLTLGRPEVTDVIPAGGQDEDELLATAAAAESGSEHALGRAILREAADRGLQWSRARDFRAITGRGARARVDHRVVHVGRPSWIAELGAETTEIDEDVRRLQSQARTVVLVARGEGDSVSVLGAIAIADRPREEAREATDKLRAMGVERLMMLTGDAEGVAASVASELGIDEYAAELMPDQKVDRIKKIRQSGLVAMIGDGVNDAPALALADVGVAMGAAGTDAALETADIALMADDLSKLPYALRLSRMALRIVKQNIVASIAIKLAFMALVVPGALTLWMAILGDTGVSIAVTLNSMRLLKLKSDT